MPETQVAVLIEPDAYCCTDQGRQACVAKYYKLMFAR